MILKSQEAGVIFDSPSTTAPKRALYCNGASYLRADYPRLFAKIGTAFGSASGAHFNVPDRRGYFVRGQADAQVTDPDRAARTAQAAGGATGDNIGSVQANTFGSHAHVMNAHNHNQDAHNHAQDAHTHTQNAHAHSSRSLTGDTNILGGTNGPRAIDIGGTYNEATTSTTAVNQNTTAVNQVATATNQATVATMINEGGNETRPLNTYTRYYITY